MKSQQESNYSTNKSARLEVGISKSYEITLSAKESKNFVEVLLKPVKPNLALKKAAKRHSDFLSSIC
ncbi:DUF1778 domain-containing protein [Thiotrichales bacterium 19S3-7]|nr:DUF1778 domain-containing protein [Thiotrichales bacterium 19S3-7]MCF6802835.1 DUF1778 domain-containing protein [Thiotrichales bacterium 19S3-11]